MNIILNKTKYVLVGNKNSIARVFLSKNEKLLPKGANRQIAYCLPDNGLISPHI